jgi:hypothetical protein
MNRVLPAEAAATSNGTLIVSTHIRFLLYRNWKVT